MTLQEALLEKTPYDADGKRICTCAVVIRDDGRMLFGKTVKYEAPVWGTPGGSTEPEDANVGEALLREIKEETGLTDVEIVDFLGVSPGRNPTHTMRTFLVQVLSGEPQVTEPDVMPEWRYMTYDELQATGIPFVNAHIMGMLRESGRM